MKKTLTFLFGVVCCTLFNNASAQNQPYVGVNLGYGLGAVPAYLGSNYSSPNDSTWNDEIIYGSLGKGLTGGIRIGAPICESADLELNFGGWHGKKYTFTDNSNYFGTDVNSTMTINSCGWLFEPMIRFRPCHDQDDRLSWYTRQGFLLALGGKNTVVTNSTSTSTFFTNTSTQTQIEKANMGFGYSGALGAEYKLNDNMSLNLETQFRGFNLSWKSSTITDYSSVSTSGGQSTTVTLADLTVAQKETVYKKSTNNDDNTNGSDETKPTVESQEYKPYSSWGFRIGFAIYFGGGTR